MLTRRELIALLPATTLAAEENASCLLTFDDAVKPPQLCRAILLKDLGSNATFFITHRWMDNAGHFLTWPEVAEIHEIGNHSWTHASFSTPKAAARLEAELSLVEAELNKIGVPKPVSCPRLHSDPLLPDCKPGETVRVHGRLWFEET